MPDEIVTPGAETPASQPDASPPASDPPSDAPETPPADTGEPKPADGADAPGEPDALALSDEDKSAFIDLYGDAFEEHPKFKALVERQVQAARDREKTEARSKPDSDPLYRELQGQFQAHAARYKELTDAMRMGDDVDPDEIDAVLAVASEYGSAADRRGQMFLADAILQRTIGLEDGKLDAKNPLHKQYQALVEEQNQMLQNVYRLRRSGNVEQQQQAAMADATATATFIHKAIELGVEAGKVAGAKAERERGNKQTEAAVHTAKSNTMTEAIAKAQAAARAGRANGAAVVNGQPSSGDISYQQLLKLTPQKQAEFIASHPEKYDVMLGIK